ncbi:MAG: toprim domain-containing protein [Candidatus Aenigmarchaeota archaeon]|nr:toprim domain-containing protein [Candidatus Aenigmarchaeota archaeon]
MKAIEDIIFSEEELAMPAIVEGKKDAKALNSLGLNNVIPINGQPLASFVARLHADGVKEMAILTDFDPEGKKLHARLKGLAQGYRIKVNGNLRHKLMQTGKTRIEDFGNFEIGRGGYNGETGSYFHKVHNQGLPESQRRSGKA